jgi:hypothetical protein
VKVGSKDQQQVGNRRSWEAVLQLVAKIMAVLWQCVNGMTVQRYDCQIVTYTLSGTRKLLVYIMVTNEDSYRWGGAM